MPDPIPQSILGPVLIGRDTQVAALARLLDQARSGQGQIALINGEAGIGKSRLVAEAKLMAERSAFVTLQGNCLTAKFKFNYSKITPLPEADSAAATPRQCA